MNGYTVAVMEFAINRNISKSAAEVLEENTGNYIDMIEQAKSSVQVLFIYKKCFNNNFSPWCKYEACRSSGFSRIHFNALL